MILTNRQNLPGPIVRAVQNDPYVRTGDISVTGLIKPPQMACLEIAHEDAITEDVADRIWALLGSATHAILQRAGGDLSEVKVKKAHQGWLVTGTFDLLEGKTLTDFKVTSVWSAVYGKLEWEQQLNLYDYLARYCGHEVEGLQIIAILRDWEKKRALEHNYPAAQVVTIPINRWSHDEQHEYFITRTELHQKARRTGVYPECTPEERWERPGTYAVTKKGNKRAYRVLPTEEEATMLAHEKGNEYHVTYRPGRSPRCEDYCSAMPWCSQYMKVIQQREEEIA